MECAELVGHGEAHLALASLGTQGRGLGHRLAVGVAVHVRVLERHIPRAAVAGDEHGGGLECGELLRPTVIRRVQALIYDRRARARPSCEGRI